MFDAWLTELRDLDVTSMDRPSLCDIAVAAGSLRSALDALDARVTDAIDRLEDRGPDAATTLRSATKCSQREADRRTKRAAALREMPQTAEALKLGTIGVEHVDTLVRAAEKTSAAAVDESGLLAVASTRPADIMATDTRKWVRTHQSSAGKEETARRQRLNRRAFVLDGDDGMVVFHIELAPDAGARARSGLDAIYDRLVRDDGGRGLADQTRTPDQRRADAFEILLSGGFAADDEGDTVPRVRSQLLVIAHADGTAEIPGLGPIPSYELDRLTCVSDLFGLVFSGDGRPLWHGRPNGSRPTISGEHSSPETAAASSARRRRHAVKRTT